MNVRARTESVLAYISPGEVWFNPRRRFSHQGNCARWGDRRYFIVTRGERNFTRDTDLVIDKFGVSFAVRFQFGKHTTFCAETQTLGPRFATNKAHHLVHQIDR